MHGSVEGVLGDRHSYSDYESRRALGSGANCLSGGYQRLNKRSHVAPGIDSVWSNTSTPLSKSNDDARQSATGAGSRTFGGRSPRASAGGFSVGSKSTNAPRGKSAVIRHTRRRMVAFFT